MEEAAANKKVCAYTCHAGLMEVITPILYEDVVIAYLQIGQFRDAEGAYSTEEKIRETAMRYGISPEKLQRLYAKSPVISQEKLQALLNITQILIRSSMRSVKIEQYIGEHIGEKIYIEELCEKFSMSKFALYSLFREEFHCAVNEYILEKRMELARKLLLGQPGWNITRIASACGFADYNYFIRAFRHHTGLTPLQYRKQMRKP